MAEAAQVSRPASSGTAPSVMATKYSYHTVDVITIAIGVNGLTIFTDAFVFVIYISHILATAFDPVNVVTADIVNMTLSKTGATRISIRQKVEATS